MVEGPDDRDVLLSLGAHPDLTIFVVVAMTNRPGHSPNEASNNVIYNFFENFLKCSVFARSTVDCHL